MVAISQAYPKLSEIVQNYPTYGILKSGIGVARALYICYWCQSEVNIYVACSNADLQLYPSNMHITETSTESLGSTVICSVRLQTRNQYNREQNLLLGVWQFISACFKF